MSVELKIPSVGESITEVTVGPWNVEEGGWIAEDETVCVIETDKVNLDIPAPVSGVVTSILKAEGEDASVGDVIGAMEAAPRPADASPPAAAEAAPASAPAAAEAGAEARVMPAAQRLLDEKGLKASDVKASGPGGRLLKEDVQRHLESGGKAAAAPAKSASPAPAPAAAPRGAREKEVVPMTSLRKRVAQRLVSAQQDAAILTTFNEADMSGIMALRKEHKESFQKRYDVKLGFMSFFVKACIDGLKEFPSVNAQIQGTDIVYHHYYDIGIAVGGGKGLVVPILRNAERMSFAEVEEGISDYAKRARSGKLKLDELQGGTFTISNGGVYGSMLSTPILNPPQSAILGMHNIQQRAMVVNGAVEVRPMMYLALSYDHRIIDGRESVSFLKRVKECLENPARILLEV